MRTQSGIVYYTDGAADAPPALLISGFIGTAAFWGRFADIIARARRAVRYDHRGFGEGDKQCPQASVEQMADDAMDVLQAATDRPVDIIGHSAGAGVGMILAARAPERVRSLTLIGGWTRADTWMRRVFAVRLEAHRTAGALAYQQLTSLFMYPPTTFAPDAAAFEAAERASAKTLADHDGLSMRAAAVQAFDAARWAGDVRCPVLVLGAADDVMTPFYFSQALAAALPNARLHRLESGGHYCVRTAPEASAQPILNWLDDFEWNATQPSTGSDLGRGNHEEFEGSAGI